MSTAQRLILPRVRLSYAYLYEPFQSKFKPEEGQKPQTPKHKCTALLPKAGNEDLLATIKAAIMLGLVEEFGSEDKIPTEFKQMMSERQFGIAERLFVKDGDEDEQEAYKGCWAIEAKNAAMPKLLGPDKSKLDASSRMLASGDYANVVFKVYILNMPGNRRIMADLLGVQHVAKGEPLGGGGREVPDDVADEFGEIEPEAMGDADF